jgi:thiopeptide-type bacteriocin biosynthesis protein
VSEQQRRFIPGSPWLYVKLYGPQGVADRALVEHVGPEIRVLHEKGLIDGWFFIRYADPDDHLRLRCHGTPGDLLGKVLPALHEAMTHPFNEGLLYRIAVDTYEREVERYGGLDGVNLMEQFSEADSNAALALLAERPSRVERQSLAIAGLASLYADADLSLNARHACSVHLRSIWMPPGGHVGEVLGAKERTEGSRVAEEIAALDADEATEPWILTLRERSRITRPLLQRWRTLDEENALERPYLDVICSLAHMCVNRLLERGGNLDEVAIHHALARVYKRQIAHELSRFLPEAEYRDKGVPPD